MHRGLTHLILRDPELNPAILPIYRGGNRPREVTELRLKIYMRVI